MLWIMNRTEGHSEKHGMMGGLVWEPVKAVPWYQQLSFSLVRVHLGPSSWDSDWLAKSQENNNSNMWLLNQRKLHRAQLVLANLSVPFCTIHYSKKSKKLLIYISLGCKPLPLWYELGICKVKISPHQNLPHMSDEIVSVCFRASFGQAYLWDRSPCAFGKTLGHELHL